MMVVTLGAFGLEQLSRDEKLNLVGQLWDSILAEESPGSMLSEDQIRELDRRVQDAKTNPNDFVNWTDALAATRRRLGQ